MSEPAPTNEATQPAPEASNPVEGQEKGPSKNELKKRAKEAEKAKKAAERAAKEAEQAAARAAAEVDYAQQNYGKLPLNQSQERTGRPRAQISTFNGSKDGEEVLLRARVHTSRAQGNKMVFFSLRQRQHTVQALLVVNPESVSKQMAKWAAGIPLESIILVEGVVKRSPEEIKSATVKDAEVHINKIHLISEVEVRLPFNLEDADKAQDDEREVPTVAFDTRLNNRVLDLRTQTSQSIFTLQSAVTDLFRESLASKGFIEIHSPKLQAAATESGASVFKVDYFKGSAFLAQSPQLAKQMAIGADFERVYEIGPVFRAENSFTHRHLTEFTGLDLEMTIEEHYHEVVDVLDDMLLHIFNGLKSKFSADIEAVRRVYPSTEFTWLAKTLRLHWKDAIALLRENKVEVDDFEDFNTETEKLLGRLVKDKYNTDYYILDKFPTAIRPFYTMPSAEDPRYSNSYDFFMRGEEILSGAQRVHDAKKLEERMVEVGIDPKSMQAYLDGFKIGIAPHGGGGIGAFVNIPIDVLKEVPHIASYLHPKDILMLARASKTVRKILMQRSAIHMWRSAERNIELLPPCPPFRINEAQYAALMFTNECSRCGVSVMRGMDEYLGVRLCNACRKTSLVDCSNVSPEVQRYVPMSACKSTHLMFLHNINNPLFPVIKKGSVYALQEDVERVERGITQFSQCGSRSAYKRWKTVNKYEYNLWMKHVSSLLRYMVHAERCREDEIESRKQARRDEVVSRLQHHGWKLRDTYMISAQRNQAWRALVDVDKPLTDQAWERLYPKLHILLKRNRENWLVIGKDYRHCIRSMAESEFSNFVAGEQVYLLFPSYRELRAFHVFKDLLETDRPVDAMVAKFNKCKQLMNNAIAKWRANFERQLVLKVKSGRRKEKLDAFENGVELIEDTTSISTKLTDSSYQHVSAKNSVLLRADTIFRFKNSHWVAHYPTSFVHMADYLHKQLEDQAEGGSILVEHDELHSMFEYHEVGARVARALLAALGCPDAAYIEMNAPGMAYICGRCHYPLPHTWGMIIEHYVLEYNQWKSHSLQNSQCQGIVYNNVHCLQPSYGAKPLVRLMGSKEFNESKIRLCSPADVVECNHCVRLKLDYVFRGSRKYVALHLRDV
ncbi:asparaginyl-tRNA synthetase [Ceratobasidium sp. AG-Ba]|nr:asparaginyl-tRNA synthetase [Ceratobasidium sp. AG-Ba]